MWYLVVDDISIVKSGEKICGFKFNDLDGDGAFNNDETKLVVGKFIFQEMQPV